MNALAVVFAVVLHVPGAAVPDRYVEGTVYASQAACDAQVKFLHAFVRVDGEFKCKSLALHQ